MPRRENLIPLLTASAVLALAILIAFQIYLIREPARLQEDTAHDLQAAQTAGGEVFAAQCVACHGDHGQGGLGPALNSKPLLSATSDDLLFNLIRTGVPGTSMPAWGQAFGGPLTDEEVRQVVAYLRSWEATAPYPEQATPQPDPARGALIFNSTCIFCHGREGQGTDRAPALNDKQLLDAFDDEWFRQTIADGRPSKGMPTWGTVLSPEQIDDLVALIDTWRRGETVRTGAAANEPMVQGKPVSAFFLDTCSGCHGPTRQGATGPALLPQRLSQPDEYYHGVIKNGKPGTVMPPWGGMLSDTEIDTLIAFIHSEPEAGALEWNLSDVQASLEVLIPDDQLPAAPTHSHNIDNLMLVTERETQSIAVIDGDTHSLITHIPASYRAHGYTFSPVSERWAYNMGRDGWVFKIDLYSLQPTRKVRIGIDSRAVAISDDGRFLIAGNYVPATAVILDAGTLEPLKVISTQTTNPEGEIVDSRVATILDVSPELVGPYFLVALKEAGQVWRVDWSKADFPIVAVENVGHILHDGFLSPDNRTFYLASQVDNWMAAIDVPSMRLKAKIDTGSVPDPGSGATWEHEGVIYGASVHAGEGKVTIWNLETNEIVGSIPTAGPGLFIRTHEDTPYVWADAVFAEQPHAITVFEKAPPFKVVGVIEDGLRTLHPEFTADGRYVYISDWDGNVVRVYDAVSLEKVAEIGGVTTPTGIFNTSRRLETLGH